VLLRTPDRGPYARFHGRLGRLTLTPSSAGHALGLPFTAAGYTAGMKTAVSVPDDLFDRVDRLARRTRRSRSEVYSAALREYVARHDTDEITAALDRAVADAGSSPDRFAMEAARRTLVMSDW
jgi:predicted transcriptional regulator